MRVFSNRLSIGDNIFFTNVVSRNSADVCDPARVISRTVAEDLNSSHGRTIVVYCIKIHESGYVSLLSYRLKVAPPIYIRLEPLLPALASRKQECQASSSTRRPTSHPDVQNIFSFAFWQIKS